MGKRLQQAFAPKGEIESLEAALQYLGLPGCLTPSDQAKLPAVKSIDDKPLKDRGPAEAIQGLAITTNRLFAEMKSYPRIGKVISELRSLERAAETLKRTIEKLNPVTLELIHSGGIGVHSTLQNQGGPAAETYQKAAGSKLPSPKTGHESTTKAVDWITRLSSLTELTVRTRKHVAYYFADDQDRPDRGGSGNLFHAIHGAPKRILVSIAWDVFVRYAPAPPTGAVTGAFHEFVCRVYEYATGRAADDDGGLFDYVKQTAALNRDLPEVEAFVKRLPLLLKFLRRQTRPVQIQVEGKGVVLTHEFVSELAKDAKHLEYDLTMATLYRRKPRRVGPKTRKLLQQVNSIDLQ